MYFPWSTISRNLNFGTKGLATEARSKFYKSTGANPKLDELKYIYDLLGILDGKAASLMQFCGIVLAVLILLLQSSTYKLIDILVSISGVAALCAIAACGLITALSWGFLELAVPKNSDPSDKDIEAELTELRKVLYFREVAFRRAWLLAGFSLGIMTFATAVFVFTRLAA